MAERTTKIGKKENKPILKELSVHKPEQALYYLRRELEKRLDLRWQIADGKYMKVEDMTNTHLKNTILLLENQLQQREML